MAAISFPSDPEVDEIFTVNNRSWKWTGAKWVAAGVGIEDAISELETSLLEAITNVAAGQVEVDIWDDTEEEWTTITGGTPSIDPNVAHLWMSFNDPDAVAPPDSGPWMLWYGVTE